MDSVDQIALVEKWSLAHPCKTRQDLFLEQYPEARMWDDAVLHVDPCATMARACKDCRRGFCLHMVEC